MDKEVKNSDHYFKDFLYLEEHTRTINEVIIINYTH